MLKKSYISREGKRTPGFKPGKDSMTLLLGGNASGDASSNILLIYHCGTPRAMKGFSKYHLYVICHSYRKSWVTRTVFHEWFNKHFSPAVNKHYGNNILENEALLFLDNASGNSPNLNDEG